MLILEILGGAVLAWIIYFALRLEGRTNSDRQIQVMIAMASTRDYKEFQWLIKYRKVQEDEFIYTLFPFSMMPGSKRALERMRQQRAEERKAIMGK